MNTTYSLVLIFLFLALGVGAQNKDDVKYKTIYDQSFSSSKSTNDFEFSDESKWLISKKGKPGKSLKCLGEGEYSNVHGGPRVVAVLKHIELDDFVLEMDVVQRGQDYSLLDFCLFFGIQDVEHYCYAQIAGKADKSTHNIFMIDGDKPKRIGQKHNNGVIWGINQWHHVTLKRSKADKLVQVFFNDELVLETSDEPFMTGLVGFGSSSSALKIDNVKISAPSFIESDKSIF